ncbi:MAG TPA: class I SAM-dependent methyltransferase [Gaiellaceae bacterium]|nr:class I SAM-dependent methyltransferase [Gaiellaceae bacterium]
MTATDAAGELLAEQKRYYAARAPEYDDWWFRRGRYVDEPEQARGWLADVAELEEALRRFAPRGAVLELAAGTGIWTRRLVPLAERVVAVDANSETLALNTPAAELVQADLFEWRPEEQFDVVFFAFWLSHVPESHFERFWRLVLEALAPRGRVFLIDSGPVEREPGDERQVRRLADGREFRIVKRFWRPGELAARVRPLGVELELGVSRNGCFLYGAGAAR